MRFDPQTITVTDNKDRTYQIDALVAYISSLGSGPAIPAVDPSAGNLGQGEDLYEENCAACHSSTGIGAAPVIGNKYPILISVAVMPGVGPGPVSPLATVVGEATAAGPVAAGVPAGAPDAADARVAGAAAARRDAGG